MSAREIIQKTGALICIIILTGCGFNSSPESHVISPMYEPTEVLFPAGTPEQQQEIVLNSIEDTMGLLHEKLSFHLTESEVSTINRIGNTVRLPISRDTYNLLQLSQNFNTLMNGLFDITTTPIAYLWGFEGGRQPEREVSKDVLQAALNGIGFRNISIYKNAVELRSPYTRISFDEIAQAYAIDLSILKIRRLDYQDICISMNNLSRCLGKSSRRAPWTYPVVNPFSFQEIGTLALDSLPAAATAQTGQDYVIIAGRKYSHIIDPRTGYPARGTAAVTVLAPSATKAAALARALYIAGLEAAPDIMKNFPRCEVMIIPDTIPCTLHMTRGMANRFKASPDQEFSQQIMN